MRGVDISYNTVARLVVDAGNTELAVSVRHSAMSLKRTAVPRNTAPVVVHHDFQHLRQGCQVQSPASLL